MYFHVFSDMHLCTMWFELSLYWVSSLCVHVACRCAPSVALFVNTHALCSCVWYELCVVCYDVYKCVVCTCYSVYICTHYLLHAYGIMVCGMHKYAWLCTCVTAHVCLVCGICVVCIYVYGCTCVYSVQMCGQRMGRASWWHWRDPRPGLPR